MMTNTFTPHVGGVARSVEAFTRQYREMGHRVLVVAPEFDHMPEHEEDVIRVPAIQKFNGSDFSVRLPIPGFLSAALDEFQADVVHAHHPFLLGDTAQRAAALRNQPLVFTHHTMYEQYTHYVPADSDAMRRFVVELSTGYANLCDRVVAPSESTRSVLQQRGVTTPIDVVPTGVDTKHFARGNKRSARKQFGLPQNALVVGHVGRLAPEKNLGFLAESIASFLAKEPRAHFLLVGSGPSEPRVRQAFEQAGLGDRLHCAGSRSGLELVSAYHAMDVFTFASRSETQGMVLTEAMAAGVPVVAINAPGAREVVRDTKNGRLLEKECVEDFAAALHWFACLSPYKRRSLRVAARSTAEDFSLANCAKRALSLYEQVCAAQREPRTEKDSPWLAALRVIETEWQLWVNVAKAATTAIVESVAGSAPVPNRVG